MGMKRNQGYCEMFISFVSFSWYTLVENTSFFRKDSMDTPSTKEQRSLENRHYYLAHKAEAQARYLAHQATRIAYARYQRGDTSPEILALPQVQNGEWHVADPEKTHMTQQAYYEAHREELLLKRQQWYQEHREESCARARAWQLANPHQKKATSAAWYQTHKDEIRLKLIHLRDTDPERYAQYRAMSRASEQRRRARKSGSATVTLTRYEWELLKAHYQFQCVYCHTKPKTLTQDHLTPLSKGGEHTLWNVVPACRSCNAKKHIGPVPVPVQPLLL